MSGRFHVVTWNGGGNTTLTYAITRRLVARGHEVTLLGQSAPEEATRDLGAREVGAVARHALMVVSPFDGLGGATSGETKTS